MLSRKVAVVVTVDNARIAEGLQKLTTRHGPAINFTDLAGEIAQGDSVLLNCTATDLNLGTGGNDFVIARIRPEPEPTPSADRDAAHLMKLRYTPLQHSASSIEESPQFSDALKSGGSLSGLSVVAGELHSQIAPISAAAALTQRKSAYVMTDSAALSLGISELLPQLVHEGLISHSLSVGQAFGGDFTAVTLHNALIAARAMLSADIAIISQGPGNTGTGTKYGFSGIDQAASLNTAAALGAIPIACVRASSGDKRARHRGISHHTMTVLEMVRSRCVVAVPEGLEPPAEWLDHHDVRIVSREKTQAALDLLKERGINVTTMGRGVEEDSLFFHAAAAAGVVAAEVAECSERPPT